MGGNSGNLSNVLRERKGPLVRNLKCLYTNMRSMGRIGGPGTTKQL